MNRDSLNHKNVDATPSVDSCCDQTDFEQDPVKAPAVSFFTSPPDSLFFVRNPQCPFFFKFQSNQSKYWRVSDTQESIIDSERRK